LKVLILLLLSFSQVIYAADGSVRFAKGKVYVNGKKVVKGAPLNYQDRIVVGKKAHAIIAIKPGTIIKLKPKTILIIEKPARNKKKSFSLYSYILERGDIFVRAKNTKKNKYQVKTKNAVMGVRGTTFFVSSAKKKKNVWMCVNEGEVEVRASEKAKPVIVKAGEGVVVNSDSAPEVKQYAWTKELNWKFSGKLEEIKDATNIQNINYDIDDFDYD